VAKNNAAHKHEPSAKAQNGGSNRWTVMVFMGAGEVEGTQSLVPFLDKDIREIESVITTGGPAAKVNVFLEKRGNGWQSRKWVGVDKDWEAVPATGPGVNGMPILNFVESSLRRAEPKEWDYSLLVLWGHAYQFGFARERTLSGVDAVDFQELARALEKFQGNAQTIMKAAQPPKLDIIGFDSCDIATLELANQLAPYAKYLIGSQIGVPLPGWPYDEILARLLEPLGKTPIYPAQFGSFTVRKYCEAYSEKLASAVGDAEPPASKDKPLPVSLTLLDLERAPEAFDAAEHLAIAIARACADDEAELAGVVGDFRSSQTIAGKPFIDVADFCVNLSRNSGYEEVKQCAATLGDILIRPTHNGAQSASNGHGSNGQGPIRGSLVSDHARNAHQTAKLHGVSLYAPHILGADFDWRTTRFWYNKFDDAGETFWGRLVHVLAELS
jgi:hypothetical protein